jgi:hypothetical protein
VLCDLVVVLALDFVRRILIFGQRNIAHNTP